MSALIFALALMIDPAPAAEVDPLPTSPPPPAAEVPLAPEAPAAPVEGPVAPEASAPPPPAAEEEAVYPPDAPKDDYGLVAWCYGVLSGYLDLHDRVLPEVTRIEGTFRKPGTSLASDMAVYEDMQKISRTNMKLFERAMEAAEKASLRPINLVGAAAVAKGRSNWSAAAGLPTRTVAQQWMGWTLPAVCPTRAEQLEARSNLMGQTFKVNTEVPVEPPAAEAAPEPVSSEAATEPQPEPLLPQAEDTPPKPQS